MIERDMRMNSFQLNLLVTQTRPGLILNNQNGRGNYNDVKEIV